MKFAAGVVDRSKSLQDIEGQDWGEPNFPSSLVTTCHRLHRQALCSFEPGDFRIMIGQQLCLKTLVPLALEILDEDPLVEGTFYEGDLLCAVLEVNSSYWAENEVLGARVAAIAERALQELSRSEKKQNTTSAALEESLSIFRRGA